LPLTFLDFGTLQWGAGEHGDGLALAENVVPAYGVKRPLEGREQSGANLLTGTLNSEYPHIWPTNPSAASYVGDESTEFHSSKTNIYVYDRSVDAYTSIRSGLAAAGEPPAGRWASFGNDVWYTNRIDNLQVRAANAGNFVNGTTTSTFKPIARDICVVRNYMMVFDLSNATFGPDAYAWSVPGNPAVWDAAASGGGGAGFIRSRPGQIMRAIGGEFARVFKRGSMHALTFTGDVVGTNGGTWREDVISDGIGTAWPSSVVPGDQGAIYFLGNDFYFYRQVGMNPPERVSPYAVSAWLSDFDFSPGAISRDTPSTMSDEDLWVQGTYNPSTGIIFWAYRGKADVGPREKTRGIFYSTVTGEFTTWNGAGGAGVTHTIQTLGNIPTPSTTETLAGIVATTYFDSTSSYRWTFSNTTIYTARLVSRKQALALSEQEAPVASPVNIKGVIPVVSTEVGYTGTPAAGSYEPIPTALTVIVTVSSDPNFKTITSGATVINPRQETAVASTNADPDSDLFPFVESQGTWQYFELQLPNTAGTELRAMPGLWIAWEVAP
jgi:hypothetical protein